MKFVGPIRAAAFALGISFTSFASATVIEVIGPAANDVDNAAPVLINATTTETGTISDLDLYVYTNGAGYDLSVLLTHVDTGTTATIWLSAFGAGGNLNGFNHTFGNVDTIFDDEAALDFHPNYQSGAADSFRPVDLLSVFDGEDINGTWQLSIQNTGCCLNEGQDLLAWKITVNVDGTVPTPAPLLLITLGLLGLRRASRL